MKMKSLTLLGSRLKVGIYVRILGTGQHNSLHCHYKEHPPAYEAKVKWTTSGQQRWYSIPLIKHVLNERMEL